MRLIDADKLMLSLNDNYLANSPTGNETLAVRDYRAYMCEGLEIAMATVEGAPTVGGWISVKDRTPDAAGYECLVCAANTFGQKDVFIAFTGYGDFKWYTMDITKIGKYVHGNNEVSEAWTITHWMPLPEPPEEGEAGD